MFVEQPLAVASSANGCIGELKVKGAGVKKKRLYIGWFLFKGFTMRRQATLGISPTIKQRMKKSRSLPGGARRIVKSSVIKIVTHNSNGLDEGSEHDTKTLISRQKPDLVGIVETKLRQEDGRRELEV